MCVIVVKKRGVHLPSMGIFKECWNQNPDGAGLAYTVDGAVKIEKGFMTWESFEHAVEGLHERYPAKFLLNADMVFHFRIATSGGVVPGNTHPFPVCTSARKLRYKNQTCDMAVVHNGIIPIHPLEGLSDTMTFILFDLAYRQPDFLYFPAERYEVERAIYHSKMAFLTSDGIQLLGEFLASPSGLLYSNRHWVKPPALVFPRKKQPPRITIGGIVKR